MFQVVKAGIPESRNPANAAVRAGPMVFMTLVPRDTETGAIVEGDVAVQTRQSLVCLERTVKAAGGSLKDVAQVQVFLIDERDAKQMNAVYAEMMPEPYCCRATVVVEKLLSPVLRIEMTAVAYIEP